MYLSVFLSLKRSRARRAERYVGSRTRTGGDIPHQRASYDASSSSISLWFFPCKIKSIRPKGSHLPQFYKPQNPVPPTGNIKK